MSCKMSSALLLLSNLPFSSSLCYHLLSSQYVPLFFFLCTTYRFTKTVPRLVGSRYGPNWRKLPTPRAAHLWRNICLGIFVPILTWLSSSLLYATLTPLLAVCRWFSDILFIFANDSFHPFLHLLRWTITMKTRAFVVPPESCLPETLQSYVKTYFATS